MPITYKKTVAVLDDNCDIEEAEELLSWLIEKPKAKVNLKNLSHMHTAILQVIMASNTEVSAWPQEQAVREKMQWLLNVDTHSTS
ncbi:hypothetical protein ISG33_07255 [Glaciecola sp. MH2013]|uniref:hypothetical protein n=1 Tax=Glaciecola sp. MH2013 TaxID=2785524 RepID=UPI00189E950F|nr:hypothetical protein [Glaciecola sp. MH2013]MBF7073191.1 hypothetical protein [Glaciecola sp. MH2013]